jgi:hypothetical protein
MGESFDSKIFPLLGLLGAVLGISLFLLFKPNPPPLPAHASVFGCYVAENAPAIMIDDAGINVRQIDAPTVKFRIGRHKIGIHMDPEESISLQNSSKGYRFSFDSERQSLYWPFFRFVGNTRYSVRDENEIGGIAIVSDEGSIVLFSRSDAGACAANGR